MFNNEHGYYETEMKSRMSWSNILIGHETGLTWHNYYDKVGWL